VESARDDAKREDITVSRSATRCPYCHEDVVVAARDWVACRSCLARHHESCWAERAACSTCSEREALVSASAPPAAVTPTLPLAVELRRAQIVAELVSLERDLVPYSSAATPFAVLTAVAILVAFVSGVTGSAAGALVGIVGALLLALLTRHTARDDARQEQKRADATRRRATLAAELASLDAPPRTLPVVHHDDPPPQPLPIAR
jgi:hypothetical protein